MMSFEFFQVFIWVFIIMGWIGASIITVASIMEIIKMVKGAD